MKTIVAIRVSLAMMLLAIAGVDASATLKLHMTQYSNPSGKLWDKTVCDYLSSCDHYFKMSLDLGNSNDDAGGSYYWTQTSGYFSNQNINNFGGDISGIRNPIVQQFSPWPGSIKFKVLVKDKDDIANDDRVDDLVSLIQATPSGSELSASWKSMVMIGQRPADKTSMTMEYMLYCDANYFSSDCSVYCLAKDSDAEGHYTCDPATGNKVCRYGWEDASNSCKTRSDDCINNRCQNGATCVDGVRSYTCACPPGYAGTYCSTNINECASNPCVNGGTCTDLVNGFRCACPSAFVGPTCSLAACSVANPCLHGGTCYGAGLCRCAPGFIGADCAISRCDVLSCRNGATCANGTCVCPPGVVGGMCDTIVCDLKTCENGGTCRTGQCTCLPGFTGALCEVNIDDCVGDPCDNDGTCDDVINGFVCRCLPDYTGPRCSDVISSGDASNYTHNLEMTYTKYGEDSGMDGTKRWFIASFPVIFVLLVIIVILLVCLVRRRKRSDIMELDTSRTCLEAGDLDKKSVDFFPVNNNRSMYAVSNDYNEVKETSGSKISLYDVERKVPNDYEKPGDAAEPAERSNVYEKIVDMSPTPRVPPRNNPLGRRDSNTSC